MTDHNAPAPTAGQRPVFASAPLPPLPPLSATLAEASHATATTATTLEHATASRTSTPPPRQSTSIKSSPVTPPSIRIKKEKRSKTEKSDNAHGKFTLKRSRSPIKLIKNIRSYLHVHKQRYYGSSSSATNGTNGSGSPNSSNHNSLLAPPRSSLDSAGRHHQRTGSLPSSSIFSPCQPAPIERPPSATSMALDPEKQVLLLQVMSYFEHAGHRADEETAEYILSSYQWNIDQTLQYCQDLVQAVQGTLIAVQPQTPLSGAVNDQMTSCYIDSLLFAMFARLSAFEGLLTINLDLESDSDSDASGEMVGSRREEERQDALLRTYRLQAWLRMFVNQLRSGRLVQAHVVKELRQHLYSCGWHCPGPMDPPGSSRQEDSSELFMFLTEKLHLPYLPLEQRLLHGAKISDDDDKGDRHNGNDTDSSSASLYGVLSLEKLLAQHFYDNTLTGIRRLVSSGTGAPLSPGVEVPVSAWQVLELMPFYSSSNEQGGIIHASQSQYPADVVILPLILKRYSMGPNMRMQRIGTPIDIPRRIDFSRFVNPQARDPTTKSVRDVAESTHRPGCHPSSSSSNNTSIETRMDERLTNSDRGLAATTSSTSSISSIANPSGTNIPIIYAEPDQVKSEPIPETTATTTASSELLSTPAQGSSTPMKIDTSQLTTPQHRQYSLSLLQAAESPKTPITPPPLYTPPQSKQFQSVLDDKKTHLDPTEAYRRIDRDYLDCNPPKVRYMLELKSVVCHLGTRLDQGHYRSYVADTIGKFPPPPTASAATNGAGSSEGESSQSSSSSSSSSSSPSPSPTLQEPNWLRHDDLDPSGNRVQLIPRDSDANIEMESDWARNGYILFYELQTIQS
ncbi:hypothetical protein BGW38_000876 [Lunasporangiospora selenospora]|uniref:ubiquitinyl hydrolase 1 n=1 Tax=Lunasporangiospora selenospora TaxID=979761 RepID=A0A9P6FWE7_9FUNG|nr:hypothetical protein BGW38_000876 [Lunasporangiospora selenospora]